MTDWLKDHVWLVTACSLALTLVSVVAGTIAVLRPPADYFVAARSTPPRPSGRSKASHFVLVAAQNVLGLLLLAAGVFLSLPLVPGPGLLLILIGSSLMSFPGKRKLELRILRSKWVLRPANWLRRRAGRPSFQTPHARMPAEVTARSDG